jgi:pSer/pThr/pTyr-binding forkhead associated (FHA) protein
MKLLIQNGPGAGQIIQATRSRIAIGRSGESDIALLGDMRASRRHCEILRRGGNWIIVDTGSTNGTFVNDEPITHPTVLHHGDVVRAGACELVVLGDSEGELPGRRLAKVNSRLLQRLRDVRAAAATL